MTVKCVGYAAIVGYRSVGVGFALSTGAGSKGARSVTCVLQSKIDLQCDSEGGLFNGAPSI